MERASRLLGKLPFPSDSIQPEELVCAAWPAAVGKKIAAHTRASRMVRSSLVVEVEDAVWQRQLFTLGRHILARLNGCLGGPLVDEVQFRIVPPRREPQRARQISPRAAPDDEANDIADPGMRRIYRTERKKALA